MPASAADNPWLKMALNNAWANATLYATLAGLDRETFTAPRPGFFPSLAATMNHILEVDLYYLDALEAGGEGRGVYDRQPLENPKDLAARQAEADLRFARLSGALDETALSAPCTTERATGPVTETVANVILHLVQHQIHHRGQAHAQLSHAGIAPPQLDEFYLDFDRAQSAKAYW
ncbi:DUF664 domain-containing protein [Alphaproteobacteria bacterium GH1-50]|uniref:DUF664 domain-containing protein n=1 Tax=Kangsaoukella pontilimi TaxID=2691042 RepID=A0A7C9MLM2_9RHOB|nr:DinB family protein [Kangsaoukella pontilimi]MXQ09355.1 DUF664 domain-containing protein [Kangsaoukella pontilimi]